MMGLTIRTYRVRSVEDGTTLVARYAPGNIEEAVLLARNQAVYAARKYAEFGVSCYVEDDFGNRWWPEVE